jgi:Ca2+-transporting ATPase
MILTDDNFASIVNAVEEGRVIYDNIRKFIKYLLSSNVGEILVMFIALLAGLRLPLLAIQILWVNLVTDGVPAIALGFEPAEPDVMKRKPRPRNESILADGTGSHIIWVGILIAVLTLAGYVWGFSSNGMIPFSETLGLETFTSDELTALIGSDLVPTDWDSLTPAERTEAYLVSEEGGPLLAEDTGDGIIAAAEKHPRTIAFTVLAMTQMFEVMAIHAGDRISFFRGGFSRNRILAWAVVLTTILQIAVLYVPFFQSMLDTVAISALELGVSIGLASIVLFGVELEKAIRRRRQGATLAAH